MAKWKRQVYRLASGYDWKAKPGNNVFVADRGAVRFDFPAGWVMDQEASSTVTLRDREPPDDNCMIEMTVFYLPPGIDVREAPLPELLLYSVQHDDAEFISRGDVVHVKRRDIEIAWVETRFMDPGEHREACSRTCMARRANIQPLITFTFWEADRARLDPVWDELLRSLRLGEYMALPVQRGGN